MPRSPTTRDRCRLGVLPALASLCVGGLALASACDTEPEFQGRSAEAQLWHSDDDGVGVVVDSGKGSDLAYTRISRAC